MGLNNAMATPSSSTAAPGISCTSDGGSIPGPCGGGHEGPQSTDPRAQAYWHSWGHDRRERGRRALAASRRRPHARRLSPASTPTTASRDGVVSFFEGPAAPPVMMYGNRHAAAHGPGAAGERVGSGPGALDEAHQLLVFSE
jgi:hypothetical protein